MADGYPRSSERSDTDRKPLHQRGRVIAAAGVAMFALFVLVAVLRVQSIEKVVEDIGNLPARVASRIGPAGQGEMLAPAGPQLQAIRGLGERLSGRLVWSSNRDGNHEIYLINVATLEEQRLTDNPHVDFFARFSPDGRRIVFLRSRPEYTSVREALSWDVWLMNADGSDQRRLAERGFYPRWTADGSSIVFGRGQQVVRVDAESGEESVVFDNPGDAAQIRFGDVALGADGNRLALVLEGGAGVIRDLEAGTTTQLVGEYVCQPTFAPRDAFVAYIEAVGHGGTRVMRARPDGRRPEVLMDLPGDYSHEYFPQLSNGGEWLIWGAAAEGHEHDRADYEIFVWKLGEPWEGAVRVTYYTGNDMWPDLFVEPR
jgi:hypothetical protein